MGLHIAVLLIQIMVAAFLHCCVVPSLFHIHSCDWIVYKNLAFNVLLAHNNPAGHLKISLLSIQRNTPSFSQRIPHCSCSYSRRESLPHSRARTHATQQMTEMTFQPIQNNAGMFPPFIIKLVICWQYFLNSAVIVLFSQLSDIPSFFSSSPLKCLALSCLIAFRLY
jgi:hypothetical protein